MRRASVSLILVAGLLAGGCGSTPPSRPRPHSAVRRARARAPRDAAYAPLPPPVARGRVRVPILTYHRVHRYVTEPVKSIPDLTIEPASFDAQMSAISRAGYHAITQRQLYGALFRHARLPARPVLLTVDDGYADDAERILPALRRRRLVATFYVITRRLGQPGFLTTAQVRELERAGMDVGAHTRTHVTLPALTPPALRSEVSGSQSDLQRVLGHPVPWFAYPFGAYDAAVVRAVRAAGFVLAVTTRGGTLQSGDRALTLPRIHVGRSTTVAVILGCLRAPAACAGGA